MPPDLLRIGHVNKYWGRDRGGIEAVLHAQVGDLQRRGFQISVLACRPWGSPPRPFPQGVTGRELRAPVLASMPVHFGFQAALAALNRTCDLLHFHLPFPLAEAAALRLPKRGPWIATLHADVVGHPLWMRSLQRGITERFLRRMDAILVSSPSPSQAARLAPYGERVRMLPFGFDLTPYLGLRRAPADPRGAPVALFLGRLVAYKAIDVLLRAAAPLPLRLQIIGSGPERGRLQRLALDLGLGARAGFLGHVPDGDLPSRLSQADLFVLPSRTRAETFGVAQVEAMAAGLPVINTALATGTDWVSAHGLTGLTVTPNDVGALRDALGHMARDGAFRLACGRRARARARELFSIERRGPELAALYREVLA